ncbi:MAG: hypothetical protein NZT61_04585 [Deltaproteobacteria bacterium]|nr:hypothetical protein [Deltaproteobacteria bacterium]
MQDKLKIGRILISDQILEYLKERNVTFELYHHKPFHSCSDNDLNIQGTDVKNILLHSKKCDKVFLVVLPCSSRLSVKVLKKITGCTDLEFAPVDLCRKVLACEPGSLSVLSLLVRQAKIDIFFDNTVILETVHLHPADNTKTLAIDCKTVISLLNEKGYDVKTQTVSM